MGTTPRDAAAPSEPSKDLSPRRIHALFDLLTHCQAHAEVEDLKRPDQIAQFGSPIQPIDDSISCGPSRTISYPLLRLILHKFVLILPGLRDASLSFWSDNMAKLADALAQANLSESFDKSSLGIRRTLSTACASLLELVSRGFLGGFAIERPSSGSSEQSQHDYDSTQDEDSRRAWEDFVEQCISGDMVDRIFAKIAATSNLADHEPVVKAAHEYILTRIASFLHYILIISPRGQSLIPLISRAHDMTPYFMIRQTLRVGNAATMLRGMVKIALAKMNMSLMTGWFGGAASDSGMNLLQYIISTVLGWDIGVLKKRATTLESNKEKLPAKQAQLLKDFTSGMTVHEQEDLRQISKDKSWSIVHCINDRAEYRDMLSDAQHEAALDYLAMQLAIRDRKELIEVFCRHQPDLLTSTVRNVVTAYEPIIREMHNAVNLSNCVSDSQAFLTDLISLARLDGSNAKSTEPSVQDFCSLLKKHQANSHRFMHEAVKNSEQLRTLYKDYTKNALSHFKRRANEPSGMTCAGNFTSRLQAMYTHLSKDDQDVVAAEIDRYAEYLDRITHESAIETVDKPKGLNGQTSESARHSTNACSGSARGPGVYLSKWQDMMNHTPITPATLSGPLRWGDSASVLQSTRIDTDGSQRGPNPHTQSKTAVSQDSSPSIEQTRRILLPAFRQELVALNEVVS